MNRSDYKLRQRENLLSNSAKRLPSPPSILVPYVRSQLLSLCYNDLPSALLKPNECFSAIHIPASTQKFYLRKWNIFLSIFRVPLWCGGCEIFSKMEKRKRNGMNGIIVAPLIASRCRKSFSKLLHPNVGKKRDV